MIRGNLQARNPIENHQSTFCGYWKRGGKRGGKTFVNEA